MPVTLVNFIVRFIVFEYVICLLIVVYKAV